MDTSRWTYNEGVRWILQWRKEGKEKMITMGNLRDRIVNNSLYQEEKRWVLETPYEIRDETLRDLMKAYGIAKKMRGQEFEMKLKKKKNKSNSFAIKPDDFNKNTIPFSGTWHANLDLKKDEIEWTNGKPEISKTIRVQYERLIDRWTINVPYEKETKGEKDGIGEVIALDPGIRCFMTGYDPEGNVIEFGKNEYKRFERLRGHIETYKKIIKDKKIKRTIRQMAKKRVYRLRTKIGNLSKDLRQKVSKFLFENYKTVILPVFAIKGMISNDKNLLPKTKKAMLDLSFNKFKNWMKDKVMEYQGSQLIITDEILTSKLCGFCGKLHWGLGSQKTFKCPNCKIVMDRDFNGARNILLKTAYNMSCSPSTAYSFAKKQ
jgi:putative transposase